MHSSLNITCIFRLLFHREERGQSTCQYQKWHPTTISKTQCSLHTWPPRSTTPSNHRICYGHQLTDYTLLNPITSLQPDNTRTLNTSSWWSICSFSYHSISGLFIAIAIWFSDPVLVFTLLPRLVHVASSSPDHVDLDHQGRLSHDFIQPLLNLPLRSAFYHSQSHFNSTCSHSIKINCARPPLWQSLSGVMPSSATDSAALTGPNSSRANVGVPKCLEIFTDLSLHAPLVPKHLIPYLLLNSPTSHASETMVISSHWLHHWSPFIREQQTHHNISWTISQAFIVPLHSNSLTGFWPYFGFYIFVYV